MDKINFTSSKSNLWKKGGGILVTLITLTVIEITAWTWIRIPNPPPILLLAVVFSTFVGGLRQGLISAVITWLYTFYHFSIPGQLFHYTDESVLRIIVLTGVIPAMALLVGILKRKADRRDEISRLNVRIQAELAERKQGEERVICLNRFYSVLSKINEGWRKRRYKAVFVNKLTDAEQEAVKTQTWLEFALACKYISAEKFTEPDEKYEHIFVQIITMERKADSFCKIR